MLCPETSGSGQDHKGDSLQVQDVYSQSAKITKVTGAQEDKAWTNKHDQLGSSNN